MKLLHVLPISLLVTGSAFATQDIEITGTTRYPLITKTTPGKRAAQAPKFIRLLNVKLSEKAWKKLENYHDTSPNKREFLSRQEDLPAQVQLGMNNVPVLEQGDYGTCVTFAATAAIDAALGAGDYISQTCSLLLGSYLANNSPNFSSGWNGSDGITVLNQLEHFGIVSKETEKTVGCGGLTSYPKGNQIPDNEISLPEYNLLAKNFAGARVFWSSLMDHYEAFAEDMDRDQLLYRVKQSLNEGDRLTFGVMLFAVDQGRAGAVGQHYAPNDTWVVTPLINTLINAHEGHDGHQMIITGYDDDAIATDDRGRTHKGLLTLRNSWGISAGNAGNFYMAYDYFKRLVNEVQRIRSL